MLNVILMSVTLVIVILMSITLLIVILLIAIVMNVNMPIVIVMNVIMLNIIVMSVALLIVFAISVIVLNVVAPTFLTQGRLGARSGRAKVENLKVVCTEFSTLSRQFCFITILMLASQTATSKIEDSTQVLYFF